jgi:hypothetical protein
VFAILLIIWTWEPRKSDEPSNEVASAGARFPWRTIVPISLLAIFGGTMFFNMQIQVSNMLSDYYNISSPGSLGLFSGLAGFFVAIGTLLYRQFTAKLSVPIQLMIAFSLLGISYVMMNHSPEIRMFTVCLVVNQIGSGMLLPPLVVWAMGRLPFEFRGRGTGQPLGSQAVAYMRVQNDGNLPVTLQFLGILCLIAAAIALASRFRSSALPDAEIA